MKVAIVTSQDHGGAGSAAYRLHKGLTSAGVRSTMFVLSSKTGDPTVKVLTDGLNEQVSFGNNTESGDLWQREYRRWQQMLRAYPNRPHGLEIFTDTNSPVRLDLIKEIADADIVNFHWVGGALDYSKAPQTFANKPIVWTLHDMNPFTGGCHYASDCLEYRVSCQACPQLGSNSTDDLSKHIWDTKSRAYQSLNINVVTPSKWLADCAKKSKLFGSFPTSVIPNGIPQDVFKPYPKDELRKAFNIPLSAKVILFGAESHNNKRKGFNYLLDALNNYDLDNNSECVILTFGKNTENNISRYPVLNAGAISDEKQLAMIYSLADVFVIPSLQDNLPNTVVEAMSCGLPVVGFNIGGIPDMVEHKKTGYLVEPKNTEDLINGINWVLSSQSNIDDMARTCRKKAEREYASKVQADRYIELFNRILSKKQTLMKSWNSENKKADRSVTLFCAPKAFKGNDGVIQRNAIKSWMNFKPSPEIILFGDEEGIKEIADEFGVRHVPEIKKNQFGTPLLSDIFQRAKILASNKILTYVNSDIILLDDFAQAVAKTSERFASFLMVGRRWNLDLHDPIDFNAPNYQQILKEKVKLDGELFMPRAIDYFAFTKELCDQFPPFAIGRPGWDNWFVYKAMMTSNLIDATPVVTAIHQNHDFNHIAGGIKERQKTPDSQKNFALAGKKVVRGVGATDDATWELNANGFERKKPVGYNQQLDEFCDILIARGWESKISVYKKYFESVTKLSNVERPEVSVVVISWKHDPDTIKSFMALASQRNENFELIFVDNGGKPGEFDHLKPHIDTYVKLNANTGACVSRNIGSVFAKANIHLYLDDDGIPGADAIAQCKRAFGKYDIIAVRGSVWPKDKSAQPYSSFRNYGDKPFPTFSCQEGITAYDALAFYKVGGWNDKIVFGHEGVELSRRLLLLDPDMRKQIYDPMIVLYHDNPTDKDRVEIKKSKQSEARLAISKMFPDYNIFLKYYRLRYFQRSDLLINKNVSTAAPQSPAEHFYSTEKAKAELKKHCISEYSDKALEFNEQAKALAGQGNIAAAIDVLKEAVEEEPLFVAGYNNMGILYCHTGALQNALRAFITALNIDPLNAETVIYTAKILGATGELPRARALLENYLKNDPNNAQVQKQLSEIAMTGDINSSNAIKTYTDSPSTDQPLVTIEMITYDAERFIALAIESVLAQTYNNFELLVVDDGSTDSTADIVRSYSDSRVRYLLKDHKGRWAGTNFAINNARGEFLLAVDSDDFIAPDYVETMVAFAMKNPQSDYYYPQVFELVDQSGNITGDKWTYLDFSDNTILPNFLFEGLHSPIPYPGSLRRMSMFDRTGGYEELENVADFVFLCKNALKVKFAPVTNKAAYFYRSYGQSLSHRIEIRNKNMAKTLNEMVSIYSAEVLCPQIANIADPAQKQRQYYKYLAEIFERHVNGHMVQFGQYFKHFADIYRSKMIDACVGSNRAASIASGTDIALNLFDQGVKYIKAAQPERATECFKKAEQTGITLVNINFVKATALAMSGKIQQARDACKAELSLNSTHKGAAELLNKLDVCISA